MGLPWLIVAVSFLFLIPLDCLNAKTPDQQVPAEQGSCKQTTIDNGEWIDSAHQYINESICLPAEWVDSFFSTERLDEEVRAGSYVRWINDFVQTEGGDLEYVTKVRANVRLPKASNKLKLVFEGEQEDSIEEIASVSDEEVKTDVGLLYELFQSPRSNLNLKLNLSPRLTLRYRYAYAFSERFLTRFTQDFFKSDEEAGAKSRLDLENRFSDNLLLRWSNSSEESNLIDGIQWLSALVLYQRLSEVDALSYESSVSGVTEPETFHSNERIAIRYRRNFYRKWLFYELVPEITWPKLLITDQRQRVSLFTFRLEIKFNNM